ncbi:MAG TPA: efflux RND transporter permease subunit, partial [Massilibacterium sp.]|nr:efflux RND transporter permease subunit [Massilibacterium sp.]
MQPSSHETIACAPWSIISGVGSTGTSPSTSLESTSLITLTFPFNTDLEKVKQLVNDEVQKLDLPENADIRIDQFSFDALPIYNISIFAKGNTDAEQLLEQSIVPELKKINGVSSVSEGGLTKEMLQITVDKEKAKQAGLTLEQIKTTINDKFLSFPAGSITTENIQIPIRVEEKVETIEQLKRLSITNETLPPAQRESVTLLELAVIEPISKQSEYTRYNDQSSLSLSISKKETANTVEVADDILKTLNQYNDEIDYVIGLDQATNIKKSVSTLIKEGLFGALFASLAVLLFLRNIRATLIAIISIPLSLLITAIFLKELNITLNIMTLGGMAVAVGRVVDDSIVVIENIFRRIRKSSDKTINDELITSSTQEILKAITSSTITTVVVFLPLGLVGGITSQ